MMDDLAIQQQYYAATGAEFDEWHLQDQEHNIALSYMSALVESLGISSVLDIGCGTGRGLSHFRLKHPGLRISGLDPSQAQLQRAASKPSIGSNVLACGRGEALPYAAETFDAVCECGMLHHVRDPEPVVREMMRVARRAVFISDSNRFGQGGAPARLSKLALYTLGLWPAANWLRTGGRMWTASTRDGTAFSYSVFDSYGVLKNWADDIIVVGTEVNPRGTALRWFQPLLTSGNVFLCAIKRTAT